MSQKKTSQQSECDHILKLLEWEHYLEDGDVKSKVVKYGCTKCDITSPEPLYDVSDYKRQEVDHTNCGSECFGCKAKGLQLNTGDAGRDISDKSWNDRLAFYRQARADGIQPNGTHPVQVEAAYAASEKLGAAYNGDTMVRADKVTKGVASVMKEIGDV